MMADLSLISEAVWREAQHRAEVIRPLTEREHRPHHLIQAAAAALGQEDLADPAAAHANALLAQLARVSHTVSVQGAF